MASGRLDLFIAKLPVNQVVLTLNCGSTGSELLRIPRKTPITLKRGTIKQTIELQYLEGRECFADFMEMNYALARQFQLTALRRYSLTYAEAEQTITIAPAPLSETVSTLTTSTLGAGTLSVGYELLSRLGIPERQGMVIKVRHGKNIARMRLHIPANLSDDRIRMPSYWIQKWKLSANQQHALQFDQRNFLLSLSANTAR
ncbi:hypothetical protein [Cohnella soli]|uniref:PilZ domain-containing protein n=1 Tax=Cohnella soli TaxID=425005 RepID=A0ABW0HP78_9BACL